MYFINRCEFYIRTKTSTIFLKETQVERNSLFSLGREDHKRRVEHLKIR